MLEDASPVFRANGKPRRRSKVQCDCGSIFMVRNEDLLSGNTHSCGCLHSEMTATRSTKHGHARRGAMTRTYASFRDMNTRARNSNTDCAPYYIERGIAVCNQWNSGICDDAFANFLEYMGECPPGMEIDRWPDNDGNYEPGNVRWATLEQQGRNKRNNRVFTVNGITACLVELCERFQVPYQRTLKRLNQLHWPIERALFTPSQRP